MSAYQAGRPRISSTMTKQNPRPRKYATASERQAAYRARAPEVCFRAEAKTVETLDRIAETLDQPRADVLLSMTKFALANHDWARFGLTHRPLPYGYGLAEQEFIGPRQANPQPIWKRTRPKSLGKPVPLTPKQKAEAKKRAAAAGRKYPNLVDNIAASRLENPTMKKPTPAQLAARAKFAEMARSGAFKRKKNPTAKAATYYVHANLGYGKSAHFKVTATPGANSIRSAANQVAAHLGYPVFVSSRNERPTAEGLPVVRYEFVDNDQTKAVDLFVYPAKREGLKYVTLKSNPAKRKKTVSEKISQLVREGYPQKQAVAVALSEQRAGKVKATPRKRNPRAANPIDPMGGYGPFYGHSVEGMSESKIEYIAERFMDRLDRHLMNGTITMEQYERDTKALNQWVKEAMSKRKRNPATGRKGSGTKLNPSNSSAYKYVCIAPLEYSGSKYGIDERTPVTMKFTKTEPAAHLVYACYKLPAELVKNQDFQDFAFDYPIFYMSMAELKVRLKEFLK